MSLNWWLALGSVPGIGPVTYLQLIKRFGSPQAVFDTSFDDLLKTSKIRAQAARAIVSFKGHDRVKRELDRMDRLGIAVITIHDERYPAQLRMIPDPPPYLYVRGKLADGDACAISIVGSRSASHYGLKVTNRLAKDLAREGITIVSGMARGIDSEAHIGALAGGGRTVGVLGSGLNVVYPPENRRLYDQIVGQGAVLSEYPLDMEPDAGHFPARNRIISGMCLGVTIVEAAPKSGSLITARMALEQGREVFAVPGHVDSIRSRGAHYLIRQGAILVESAEDIMEALGELIRNWKVNRPLSPVTSQEDRFLTPEEERIISLLGGDPVHIDQLIQQGGLGPSPTTSTLLQLELKGRVRQIPGKRFLRLE